MYNTTTTQNCHVLIARNFYSSREEVNKVRIISEKFGQIVTIAYDNEPGSPNPLLETAESWLIKNGHLIIGHGEGKDHFYIICDAVAGIFKPLK